MAEGAGEEALADADPLARIAGRDRGAFAALMRRHGDRVRGLALGFGGRAGEADDIVQDVFLMLWRRPDAWRPGQAAFTTWLYRVVANRCLDRARRRRLRRWLPFGDVPEPADDAPTALAALSGRDRLLAVAGVIRTLPERQRLALLLAVQGGRSNAEIATILDISQGAVEQLLVRARRTLRAMFDERETGS
jgi:RNA polymerase sigma-70 factor (ECF subfamily)